MRPRHCHSQKFRPGCPPSVPIAGGIRATAWTCVGYRIVWMALAPHVPGATRDQAHRFPPAGAYKATLTKQKDDTLKNSTFEYTNPKLMEPSKRSNRGVAISGTQPRNRKAELPPARTPRLAGTRVSIVAGFKSDALDGWGSSPSAQRRSSARARTPAGAGHLPPRSRRRDRAPTPAY